MKAKIILLASVTCLLFSTPAYAKGEFWNSVGKLLKGTVEAAVVAGTDHLYNTYAPEEKERYQQSMQQLNEQRKRRETADSAAWATYKQGRQQELRSELTRTSDFETRQLIRQQMDELNGVSSTNDPNNETSIVRALATGVGIKDQNINRGLSWNEAQNNYERQNVAKDYFFDALGQITGQEELINKFREINTVQNTYLSDNLKALTPEEKQLALSKRNQGYASIGYAAYQVAQDRRSQHLAEKLNISKKLIESGLYDDSQLANEVAGTIISILKSDLPQQEKEVLLRAFGYSDIQQVEQAVNEVLTDNYDAIVEAQRIKAEEEAKRQAELQRQEAERKSAIERINATVLDHYLFDEVNLSESQKTTLDDIANLLNQYPDVIIHLTGHTCNIGYKSINQRKGLNRAKVVQEYLTEKEIALNRISVDSEGELQPIVKNASEANRKQNRRVEFSIE